jgi:outer membrane protein
MKNSFQLFFNILISLAVLGLIVFFYPKDKRTGYIDFKVLLNKYEGIKTAGKEFEIKAKIFKDNIDTLTAELNAEIKDFEAKQKNMSAKERGFRKDELQKKRNDLIRYQEAAGAKVQEEQEKMVNNFSKEIQTYLDEYCKSNNYKMIFYRQEGTIAYAEEGCDITEEILKGINERYKNKN